MGEGCDKLNVAAFFVAKHPTDHSPGVVCGWTYHVAGSYVQPPSRVIICPVKYSGASASITHSFATSSG